MELLPPLGWVALSAMLNVETYLLGVWWSTRYDCEIGWYLRALGGVAIHGALIWVLVRGLALSLR